MTYTPNFNDTSTVTAGILYLASSSATTISLSGFTQHSTSGLNGTQGFGVGSEFTISEGSGTEFTITVLSTNTSASTAVATISPALTGGIVAGQVIQRVSKSNHASVANHTRLRHQGQI